MAADPRDDVHEKLVARLGEEFVERRLMLERSHAASKTAAARHPRFGDRLERYRRVIRFALNVTGMREIGRRNLRRIETRSNLVQLAGLPSSLHGYTLLHISDLHLDLAPDMADTLARAIDGAVYQACVLTGDFRAETVGPWQPSVDALARVLPKIDAPVFAVLGNHDSLRMLPAIEALGVTVLMNESLPLSNDGLYLAGVDDAHYFGTHDVAAATAGVPDGTVKILLSHTPEIYRDAARHGFDLMLSGHTHGGQICLPGGIPVIVNADCPRAMCRGRWSHGALQGYTTTGSGASVVDVRFNCPPEIVLHQLLAAERP